MKRRRGKHDVQSPAADTAGKTGALEALFSSYLRQAILAIATALLVSTPLVPSEGIIRDGNGATWHVMWLALAVISLLGSTLCAPSAQRWSWADLCVVALVGWHVLSAALCEGNQRYAWNAAWQWATYGAVAVVLRQQLIRAQETRALVAVMLSMALAVSLLGYYQYTVVQPAQRAQFEKDPEVFYQRLGLSEADTAAREQARNRIESKEPTGEFALTNTLAGYLLPWLLLALAIAFWSVQKQIDRKSLHTLLALAVLLAGMLVLTKSRTAWLAAVAGCGLIFLYCRPAGWRLDWRWPAGLAAGAIVIGLIAVAAQGLDAKVLSESPKSVLYRLEYWRATAGLIADEPWFGVGPGNFQERYVNYKLPQASETVQDPHNFLLEIWSTAGTPALLALLGLMFATAWQLSRRSPVTDNAPPLTLAHDAAAEIKISQFAIYAGAVLGLMLAGILALLTLDPLVTTHTGDVGRDEVSGIPIIWLTGFASLVVGIVGLNGWIERGELPRSAVIIALIALLLNLLAAGAAIFAGVVNAAWLLWAIALQSDAAATNETAPTQQQSADWMKWISLGGGVVYVAALLGCYFTEYRPISDAQTQMLDFFVARNNGKFTQAAAALDDALATDPWSPEPRRMLAEVRHSEWFNNPIQKNWGPFLDAAEEYRRSSPQHYLQHEQRGRWLFNAARRTSKHAERLKLAAEAYEAASKCYPNSALLHAQLALVYADQQRTADAKREADEAARLDALCPHQEQKLEKRVLYDPQPLLPAAAAAKLKQRTAAEVVAELRGLPKREQKSAAKEPAAKIPAAKENTEKQS